MTETELALAGGLMRGLSVPRAAQEAGIGVGVAKGLTKKHGGLAAFLAAYSGNPAHATVQEAPEAEPEDDDDEPEADEEEEEEAPEEDDEEAEVEPEAEEVEGVVAGVAPVEPVATLAPPSRYVSAGHKGGSVTAARHGSAHMRAIGKRGGEAILNSYGSEYYRRIGRKGGQAIAQRGAEHMAAIGRLGNEARRR